MQPVLWMLLGAPAGFLARFLLGCSPHKWHWNMLCGTLGAASATQIARCCGWPPLNKADFYGFTLAIWGACLVQGAALLIGRKIKQ